MKHRKTIISIIAIILAAVMLIGLVASVIPYAFAASSDEIQDEIDELEAKSAEIDDKKAELQEQIDSIDAETATILEQKSVIDQQINLTMEKISNTEALIEQYDLLISEKKEVLREAEDAENELYEQYKARIRAMEESSDVTYIAVLFSANSFTDFLDRIEWITSISSADRAMMDELSAATAEIQSAKDELLDAQTQQEAQASLLEEQKATLQEESDKQQELADQYQQDSDELAVVQETYADAQEELLAEIAEKQEEYDEAVAKEEEERRKAEEASSGTSTDSTGSGSGTTTSSSGGSISLIRPVSGGWISDPYGWREVHPIYGDSRMHYGIDYAVNLGTPVYAAASGTVSIAKYSDAEGNWVMISHANGFATAYLHLFSYCVSVGDYVSQGQVIGYSGNTGPVGTGYHLHFSCYLNGSFVNPADYLVS